MTVAEALMSYVLDMSWADLPDPVVQEAKARTLDLLGVALAAGEDPAGRAITSHVAGRGEGGPCTVLSTSRRVSAPLAALANGVLGHCLELDDEHHPTLAHVGVVAVPTSLAIAETTDRSGRDFLLAVIAGYEVMGRVGRAAAPGVLHDRGFHPTGLFGTFAAAGAAAKAMDLHLPQAVSALGIAGSLASSIFEFVADGSLTKRLHPGWAAHSGIVAAQLATAGLTGPASVFEGRHGFFHAFAGEDAYDCARITDNLGEGFEITQTAYKPYACCSYIHSAIDAVLGLCQVNRLAPHEIETIEIYVHPDTLHIIAEPTGRKKRPLTVADAQFSVYFGVAAALLAQPSGSMAAYVEWFRPERLSHPGLLALAGRIRCLGDPSFAGDFPSRYPARAVVTTREGRRLSHSVRTHWGDPIENCTRFSLSQIEERFRLITEGVLTRERQKNVLMRIRDLDALSSIRDLTKVIHEG